MRNKIRTVAILAMAIVAPLSHAQTQTSRDPTPEDTSCSAVAPADRGTILTLIGDNPHEILFTFENATWYDLKDDSTYLFDVRFDSYPVWPVEAFTWVSPEGDSRAFAFMHIVDETSGSDPFLVQFARSKTLNVSKKGLPIASVHLPRPAEALRDLRECLGKLRSGDPFRLIEPEER